MGVVVVVVYEKLGLIQSHVFALKSRDATTSLYSSIRYTTLKAKQRLTRQPRFPLERYIKYKTTSIYLYIIELFTVLPPLSHRLHNSGQNRTIIFLAYNMFLTSLHQYINLPAGGPWRGNSRRFCPFDQVVRCDPTLPAFSYRKKWAVKKERWWQHVGCVSIRTLLQKLVM